MGMSSMSNTGASSACVDTNAAEDTLYGALCAEFGKACGKGDGGSGGSGGEVTRRRLDLGDVEFRRGDAVLLIERKSWSDWAASVQGGRYKEQKQRFLASRDEHPKDDVRYVYLIEGPLTPMSGATRGMQNNALNAAILMTQLRDGFQVVRVPSGGASEALVYMYKKFREGLLLGPGATQSGTRVVVGGSGSGGRARKRANLEENPMAQRAAMLESIPGMSLDKAEALVAAFPSFPRLAEAAGVPGRIGDVTYSRSGAAKARRIGNKLEERIVAALGIGKEKGA